MADRDQHRPDLYSIQNAAVPNKMLQPADPIHPSPVVLGGHTFPPGGPDQLHVWKVTSPLLHH